MDNSFLSFLSGMEASEAKRRYEFQLKDNPADKWWHYLIVKPRLAADQAEFQTARVVLHSQAQPAQAYLPKQMILVQPNGNELQWDVKEINPAASVPATYFVKPPLPPGWKFVDEVPPNVPPPVRGGPQLPAGNVPPPSKIRQSGGG
jgi:hypothetical protein